MKAAILVETGKPLIIAELKLPEKLEPGQVLVKVQYSGICGSQINEIHAAKGEDKYLPHLLGHEGVGIVLETGPGVTQVKKDDRVVMHWRPNKSGLQCQPPKYDWNNKQVNAGWVTTFNEKAIVAENRLTVIDDEIDARLAPLFGCAITTAMGVINNDAQVKLGQSVVVFGLGGVGLNIVQGANLVSAHPIVGIDLTEEKINKAKQLGLTYGLLGASSTLPQDIRAIVGEAGADVVIDTTGNGRIIETAYELTNSDGKTILVGVPKKNDLISIYSLPLHFNKVLKGSHGGQSVPNRDIPRYMKLWRTGKLKLDDLITHEFSLTMINEAIDVVKSGAAGRVIINMGLS
ncbi:MAG: dehydrogenase [Gammaproteobacteria bacterium RIFCSPHIGHO2_12_FULL_38_14]|nr:MAG: dehydrogenase [Gammaproteobacteria bacterium RIFCSPHIGHO2_12_FULL_38_14]